MSAERAAPAGGGGGGKRHKGAYVHSKHTGRGASQLGPGMRGVLITCDVHMEKAAIGEAFRLIDELLETEGSHASADTKPVAEAPARAIAATTAGDSLAAELAALQQQKPSVSDAAKGHVSAARGACVRRIISRRPTPRGCDN